MLQSLKTDVPPQADKWTEFHQAKVKSHYPKWPVEAMVKTLFGSYLQRKPDLKCGSRVLDVGCGFGNNMLPFLEAECVVSGVEISQDIAEMTTELLREKGYKNFDIKNGSNRSLPYPDKTFDLVVSNNVVHYEPSEELLLQALQEYRRVLKEDGSLFLITVGPEHAIYKRAMSLGGHRYKIKNYDFRNDQIYFYFDNEKYLEHYMSKFFQHVEIGRVTEKLMTVELDFLIAVCSPKD
jgi:SAM-dependent methyltransferase